MPANTQVLAVASGAAAVAAGAYLTLNSSRYIVRYIVVFAEGSKKGLRVPRCDSLDVLRGQVESGLHIDSCRLFIAQVRRKIRIATACWYISQA